MALRHAQRPAQAPAAVGCRPPPLTPPAAAAGANDDDAARVYNARRKIPRWLFIAPPSSCGCGSWHISGSMPCTAWHPHMSDATEVAVLFQPSKPSPNLYTSKVVTRKLFRGCFFLPSFPTLLLPFFSPFPFSLPFPATKCPLKCS